MNRAHSSPVRRGFTLIELLVVIAIISVISGLVIPGILEARKRAAIIKCASNLKQIYTFALLHSEHRGRGAFPIGSGKAPPAHESLGELFRYESKKLDPEVLVCDASDATKPEAAREGESFTLDAESCPFAWTMRRLKNSADRQPLGSDKYVDGYVDEDGSHSGHSGGMNVLYTDGSVVFVMAEELDPETMLPPGLTR